MTLSRTAFDRRVRAPVTSVADEISGVGIVSTISTILWAQNDFRIKSPLKPLSPKNGENSPSPICLAKRASVLAQTGEGLERGGQLASLWRGCWELDFDGFAWESVSPEEMATLLEMLLKPMGHFPSH
ncbi:hypothetical protein RHGRI_033697 [Rhododendron griersonianum]|uniref:Uncharacterized protein n=1 Tax=Rhododendron griersonianum TaxID=479676 RepID=A0AAV6I0U9_9ERIC|nr:hypothetical protein RHGRI_033697 [Rhododendron griersonianum]